MIKIEADNLVIDSSKGLVILNSCSHGGVINIVNEVRKEGIGCDYSCVRCQIGIQVPAYPSTDNGIVGDDQNRHYSIQPPANIHESTGRKMPECADRTFAAGPADDSFRNNHGIAEGQRQKDIYQKKDAASVFCGQIWEPPDISKPDRCACGRQNKAELAAERSAVIVFIVQENASFDCAVSV